MEMELLFKKVGEGEEKNEGKNVPINWEHNLADAHVEGKAWDHMKTCIPKLEGQHGYVKLPFLRDGAYSPTATRIRHCYFLLKNEIQGLLQNWMVVLGLS